MIADIGTGSGCVAVSLALGCPDARLVAVDISEKALELARENSTINKVSERIEFRHGDLLQGLGVAVLDAVVSNLPYISTGECAALPRHIRDFEPMSALDGGPDGLDLIRRLIVESRTALTVGGWIFIEIGFDQGPAVVGLLKDNGYVNVAIRPDLGGRDRVVFGHLAV
jgi:release factor glutamine methyltransferase